MPIPNHLSPKDMPDDGIVRGPPAKSKHWQALKIAVIAAAVALVAAAVFLPAMGTAKPAARRAQCLNHLKLIGVALLNYEIAHGALPPAYVADSNGRPIHSWRVLILPYFEGVPGTKELYEEYSFDEPWDGPHNRPLLRRMPSCYRCPADESAGPFTTNYVAVVGAETAWPFDRGRRPEEIADGEPNTIAVVETFGLDILWTEPGDLEFAMMDFAINPQSGYGMSSKHSPEYSMADVLLCDGRVHTLFFPAGREMDTGAVYRCRR